MYRLFITLLTFLSVSSLTFIPNGATGFLSQKYTPTFTNCGPKDINFHISTVEFDSFPALGHNVTLSLTGKSQNKGFTTGSFELTLNNSGQSVFTDNGQLNQTQYKPGDNYTFNYVLALSNFIPSGNYQFVLQVHQPETFPDNEILCLNITFTAF